MTDENLETHIEDIINAIKQDSKKEVKKEELEKELEKFMEYGVPIDQAKQTLIKKFGGVAVLTNQTSSERTLISELKPNQSSVKLLGHIIAINPKEITVRGENKTIFYGILGDESGTIPFTAWSPIEVDKGDVVEVSNAYTREWQGSVQLNLGDRVKVEKTDKDRLPKAAFEPKKAKVNELRSGIGRVDVTAKVLEINEREANVEGEPKKVFSGIIADDTGKAQFTAWDDFKIKENDVLHINGGYVKSWKGIPQLTFDSSVTVKKLDKNKIKKDEIEVKQIPLHRLVEDKGALDIKIQGTVIDIRPGSGFVNRCPECKRVIQNNECEIHGKVKGVSDLRIKLVVDDGTGAVFSVLNRDVSMQILGKDANEIKNMKQDELLNEINSKLFGMQISLRGNALSDDFGITFIPSNGEILEINVEEEAEKIANGLEDIL